MQPREQLDRLRRLQRADDARHRAQHAELRARARGLGRGRAREEAAEARPRAGPEVVHAELPVELLRGAAHERAPQVHSGVGEEVARREVVRAVEDEVVRREERRGVRGRERRRVCVDLHAGVDSGWGGEAGDGSARDEGEGCAYCLRASAAERALCMPTRASVCRTCRCRLDSSTRSWSIMPMRPAWRCLSGQKQERGKQRTYTRCGQVLESRAPEAACADDGDRGVL